MSFHAKVVLVTGGTSGIGRETAIQFAREGAKVVLAGRRTEQGEAVVKEIEAAGGEARFVQTDVTKEDQVKHLVEEAVRHFGRLDIAFNNAGIEQTAPIIEFTEADYRKVFDINVLGVFLSQKYAYIVDLSPTEKSHDPDSQSRRPRPRHSRLARHLSHIFVRIIS